MTKIQGTNVAGPVVPFDTSDTYPSHIDQHGQGGWRPVQTVTDRDAIPAPRRREGMCVYVVADGLEYVLGADLLTWSVKPGVGGGAGAYNSAFDLGGFPQQLQARILANSLDITNPTETDCSPYLQAAIDYCKAHGIRNMVTPPGTYLLKSSRDFSGASDLMLFEYGARFLTHPGITAPSGSALDYRFPGLASTYSASTCTHIKADGAANVKIIGAELNGNYENIPDVAFFAHLWVQNCTCLTFHDVVLDKVKSIFLFGDNCIGCGFTGKSTFKGNAYGSQVCKYITQKSFAGTGANDLLVKATIPKGWGYYTDRRKYQIKIASVSPDTYVWREAAGGLSDGMWDTWGAWTTVPRAIPTLTSPEIAWYGAPLDGMWDYPVDAPQPLLNDDGTILQEPIHLLDIRDTMVAGRSFLSVSFAGTTGHVVGDTWTFEWAETRAGSVAFQDSVANRNSGSANNFISDGCRFGGWPTDIGSTFVINQRDFYTRDSFVDTFAISGSSGIDIADSTVAYVELVGSMEEFELKDSTVIRPYYVDPAKGMGSYIGLFIMAGWEGVTVSGNTFIGQESSTYGTGIYIYNDGGTKSNLDATHNHFVQTATDKTYYGVQAIGGAPTITGITIVKDNRVSGANISLYDTTVASWAEEVKQTNQKTYLYPSGAGAFTGFNYESYVNATGNNSASVYNLAFTTIKQDNYDYSQGFSNQFATVLTGGGTVNKNSNVAAFTYVNNAGAVVVNDYGFFSGQAVIAGAITNKSHFHVASSPGCTVEIGLNIPALYGSTKWAIYSAGAGTPSDHLGNFSIAGNLITANTQELGLATWTAGNYGAIGYVMSIDYPINIIVPSGPGVYVNGVALTSNDPNAFHSNASNEISGLPGYTPAANDSALLERWANGNSKGRTTVADLLTQASGYVYGYTYVSSSSLQTISGASKGRTFFLCSGAEARIETLNNGDFFYFKNVDTGGATISLWYSSAALQKADGTLVSGSYPSITLAPKQAIRLECYGNTYFCTVIGPHRLADHIDYSSLGAAINVTLSASASYSPPAAWTVYTIPFSVTGLNDGFTVSNGQITPPAVGRYQISYSIGVKDSAGAATGIYTWLMIGSASPAGTTVLTIMDLNGWREHGKTITLDLAATDTVYVQCTRGSTESYLIEKDQTILSMTRIR